MDDDEPWSWRTLAARIESERQRGLQSKLADHLGMDRAYFSRKLRAAKGYPDTRTAQQIDAFFAGQPANEDGPPAQGAASRRIPVYGYAAARGDDRVTFAEGDVLEWREPPPGLEHRDDFFIIVVAGGSMEPRIFSGEQLVAQRNKPPAREQDVVVELKDGTAIVKTYRRSRDGVYHLYQYSPEREITLPWDEVKAMHAVFARL